MEISNSVLPIGPAVGMAVQKMMLDSTKTDGAGLIRLMVSGPSMSTNSPTQGRFLDVRA